MNGQNPGSKPYGFLEVLERDAELGPEHGAARLAIIFLGADGHATYDALFCQGKNPQATLCHPAAGPWIRRQLFKSLAEAG